MVKKKSMLITFSRPLLNFKNDDGLRKGLVTNYISNLSPADIIKLMAGD